MDRSDRTSPETNDIILQLMSLLVAFGAVDAKVLASWLIHRISNVLNCHYPTGILWLAPKQFVEYARVPAVS